MELFDSAEYEVLVIAPFGRDAIAAVEVLAKHAIRSSVVSSLADLRDRLREPVGALMIAEEALTTRGAADLKDALSNQAPWSNLPLILLTHTVERSLQTERIIEQVGVNGNVSLLERPFRILTLVSSIRVALQSRRRQYEVRALLLEQSLAVEKQIRAVSQRDEFLSIASHELKTPITSMKLQVQVRKRMLSRGDLSISSPEKIAGLLDFTETQLNRLSRLVDDMLDISRIVNGKLSLNREPAELGQLVSEVLEGFADQFRAANCSIDFRRSEAVYGDWDRYRIEQVVANLFGNAIKYAPNGAVTITVRSEKDTALLIVKDSGPGVAPKNQERIFQRFERAISGNDVSGLGLGLFISRQILDLHGGSIQIESQLGTGATFLVALPANSAMPER